ncbi:MFS transporter [Saccharothrix sp. S26]|uniref:MFS transporter n=1 Tax=Saccharothrix sp. S26 TaxID=2907215 RepID=UPI001F27B2C1|nr:MFS transporter [Saccharothrix sp. S26]MCE6996405.1 MFS transporter [Saccharothrix sp. S26]
MPPAPPQARRLGPALLLLGFAQLIITVDFNIVYVALPEIGDALGFSAQTLQWVISAYAVAFGGLLVLGGRAADLLGRRRMFVLALTVYAVASLIGGLAPNTGVMIAARALQGLGGALLFPATLSLVNTMFAEGKERNRALAVWSACGASGLCLGSLLGGLLTDAFGWTSVFYVNVPLAGVAALVAFALIPRDPARERNRTFDLPGAITATLGVTLLVFVLVQGPESGWASPEILISLVLSIVLLVAFAIIEGRSRDPLMPLRLFTNRSLSTAMSIAFVFGATYSTVPYFLTVFFQTVHGYNALQTGLAFLVPAVLIAVGTQISGRMAGKVDMRVILILGMSIGIVGTAAIAYGMSNAGGSYLAVLPGFALYGIGQGITWTGMWIAAASGVAGGEQGVASAMTSTAMQVGTAVGLAVLVAIANPGAIGFTTDTLQSAVYVAAIGIVLGILVSFALRKQRAETTVVPAEAVTVTD